jgi:hypothetical protein
MNEAAVLRHSEGKRFQTQLGAETGRQLQVASFTQPLTVRTCIACAEFVRAGLSLKDEPAPAADAVAVPGTAAHVPEEAPMWTPPAHVLASDSEDSQPETGAGGEVSGDEFDWCAEEAAAEEDVPVVVRQPGRGMHAAHGKPPRHAAAAALPQRRSKKARHT